MARPEAKIENYLVARCEAAGALVRKLAYIGRRGAPDRMVIWPKATRIEVPKCDLKTIGGTVYDVNRNGIRISATDPYVDFVELKAFGKKPDPHQEREHQRLRELGANVHVIDSKEAVDAYVRERTA